MDPQLFQLLLLSGQGLISTLGFLAWYSIGSKIDAVKELHNQRFESAERRIEKVEDKCQDCPSHH